MTTTVVAVYDDSRTAEEAVQRLIDEGFEVGKISMVFRDNTEAYLKQVGEREEEAEEFVEESMIGEGAESGAGVGAAVGGMAGALVGVGLWFMPAVGPVLAAGPLAAALSSLLGAGAGAAAGGAIGGLVGALAEVGIGGEEAEPLAEAVRRGSTLIVMEVPGDEAGKIRSILQAYDPVDLEARMSEWRGKGWEGWDPDAVPLEYKAYKAHPPEKEEIDNYVSAEYAQGFGEHDDLYRQHYGEELAGTGRDYRFYLPGYAYGYRLAIDERFRYGDWEQIEGEARMRWEREDNPGPWEEFEGAIRFAFEELKEILNEDTNFPERMEPEKITEPEEVEKELARAELNRQKREKGEAQQDEAARRRADRTEPVEGQEPSYLDTAPESARDED